MKAETTGFLLKAEEFLRKSRDMLHGWPDEAGRAAYFAAFHAAQALLFEELGKTPKTHSGVQMQFAQQVKNSGGLNEELRGFLGRAFRMKTAADYETGAERMVTNAQAIVAIDGATRFVDAITAIIAGNSDP